MATMMASVPSRSRKRDVPRESFATLQGISAKRNFPRTFFFILQAFFLSSSFLKKSCCARFVAYAKFQKSRPRARLRGRGQAACACSRTLDRDAAHVEVVVHAAGGHTRAGIHVFG